MTRELIGFGESVEWEMGKTHRRSEGGNVIGQKDDEGKLEWDLVPMKEMEEVVRVLMHGEAKYGKDNWQGVKDARRRYLNAAFRHLVAAMKGETKDKDSELDPLAHAVCSILFAMHFGKEKRSNDDNEIVEAI